MSLSRESVSAGRRNVIKRGMPPGILNIADYRSVLEEINSDSRNIVKVDVDELVDDMSQQDGGDPGKSVPHDLQDNSRGAVAEAFERGFEDGRAEALRNLELEFEKKATEAAGSFADLVNAFQAEVSRYNQEFDRAIVSLSIAIARRIVAREIGSDEHAVLGRSREAIRKIIGVDKIKIHVNPSDEEYIREHRNELSLYADSVKEISIEADAKVERGGCIIESELGNIDARVSTQFEIIEEALLGLAKQ